jgi:hypothetical protein
VLRRQEVAGHDRGQPPKVIAIKNSDISERFFEFYNYLLRRRKSGGSFLPD